MEGLRAQEVVANFALEVGCGECQVVGSMNVIYKWTMHSGCMVIQSIQFGCPMNVKLKVGADQTCCSDVS